MNFSLSEQLGLHLQRNVVQVYLLLGSNTLHGMWLLGRILRSLGSDESITFTFIIVQVGFKSSTSFFYERENPYNSFSDN